MKVSKIKIEITKSSGWYIKGEIHIVLNEINFGFIGGRPCFSKTNHTDGVELNHCNVIGPAPTEYTTKQLEKKLGHEFIIVED